MRFDLRVCVLGYSIYSRADDCIGLNDMWL